MVKRRSTSLQKGMMSRRSVTTQALAVKCLTALGSNISMAIARELSSGNHQKIIEAEIHPNDYNDAASFCVDYLAVSLLSKYPYLDIEVDRAAVALEKFALAEKLCSASNLRLKGKVPGSVRSPYTPEAIFHRSREKISSLLGPFSWDEADQFFAWGPGATTSLPRRKGDAYFKFGASKLQTTQANSIVAWCALKKRPLWLNSYLRSRGLADVEIKDLSMVFDFVSGNRVTTVPKSAKTDRTIAIEPDLNMFVQKGLGGVIRSRLKRVGIDLDDQSRNQRLAKLGSEDGSLSTIDLSMASDSVSRALVQQLLPTDWCEAIELCRSPFGTLPSGEQIYYQKVSSMGNGFTFELESLIFWALASAVRDLFHPVTRSVAVYGDDIIVSSEIASSLLWVLDYAGFVPNRGKTFTSGPFRESCGKHYFRGVDVTPFYMRDRVETTDRLIWFANKIRSWSKLSYGLDPLLRPVYQTVVQLLPERLQKPSIPEKLGDIALWGDLDECCPSWDRYLQCWTARGVAQSSATLERFGDGVLLKSLCNLERSPGPSWRMSAFVPTGRTYWKPVKVPITQWESYGPWLG